MGGLTSKYLEEMMQTPPRSTHVLRSDPRSPSDNINRTPISVKDTPEQNGRNGSITPATTRVLPYDPRSPTTEMTRTPILVEHKEPPRRPFSLRPSRLIDPQTVTDNDSSDPRSPTSRVPRTPLTDQTHSFTNKDIGEENTVEEKQEVIEEPKKCEKTEEKDDQDSTNASSSSDDENKEVTPTAPQKEYLNLNGGNKRSANSKSSNPQSLLQARQCQAIEAEYSKSQQVIITQLTDDEKNVSMPSNTQFVENI